jgi:hypothetical protein
MAWLRWIVVALVALEAGYMLVDGLHALIRGDYITPRSGRHAGQLGPWAGIVGRVGIDPRSIAMKLFFVDYGLGWLAVAVAFGLGYSWAWVGMLILALGSLWYLVPGTLISLLVIALLLMPGVRDGLAG